MMLMCRVSLLGGVRLWRGWRRQMRGLRGLVVCSSWWMDDDESSEGLVVASVSLVGACT